VLAVAGMPWARVENKLMKNWIYILFSAVILAAMPLAASGQNAGKTLTPAEARRLTRLFDEHIVRMGETAYSIARGYGISPLTLAEDNPGVTLTQIRPGQVLFIRKKERGKTDPTEVSSEWQELISGPPEQSQAATWTPEDGVQGLPQGSPDWPQQDSLAGQQADWQYGREAENRMEVRDFSTGGTPRIALMLPLTGTSANQTGNDFTNFYKGALLALDDLKNAGHSATVTVYDTGASAEKVENIITTAEFIESDLIIGPVFEDALEPAVRFGDYFGVPVISPLATVQNLDSEVLWQMAPGTDTKYDKLRSLWEGDANVILVSSGASNDAEFEREITAELGSRNYGRFTIGQGNVASLIDWGRPNVLVVLAGNEQTVNMALATISSSYSNASARNGRRADISVIGTSKWVNYSDGVSLDQNLLFKLNAKFVTSYYINRADSKMRRFEARYVVAYGGSPSRAAFRGYDAVALFAGALFESGFSFADRLERVGDAPLGTPYRFVQTDGGARRVNDQWTLVSFGSDYSITTQ
jgi:LysM repeat protein